MRTELLRQLEAHLGRPSGSLPALEALSDEQIGVLDAAVQATCARHQQALDAAYGRALPWPLRGPILRLLRRGS
ncbi:MAG: hypothetical protein ACRETW_06835 [Stenotrophobium sp.]